MMSKKPYRSDMISFFPGKRERFSHRTGNPLSHPAIETLSIISFSGFLPRWTMAVPRKNLAVRIPNICKNHSTLSVNARHGPPQSRGTFPVTISDMNSAISFVSVSFANHVRYLFLLFLTDVRISSHPVVRCPSGLSLTGTAFRIFSYSSLTQFCGHRSGTLAVPAVPAGGIFSGGGLSAGSPVSCEIIIFSGCSAKLPPHRSHRNPGFPL